jgi:hypothetical protein
VCCHPSHDLTDPLGLQPPRSVAHVGPFGSVRATNARPVVGIGEIPTDTPLWHTDCWPFRKTSPTTSRDNTALCALSRPAGRQSGSEISFVHFRVASRPQNRQRCAVRKFGCFLAAFCLVLAGMGSQAVANIDNIYQWAWADPNNPSKGVVQSSTLCPDGAGASAGPHATLDWLDLTQAYLISADLSNASAIYTTLTNANLSNATLPGAYLAGADLTNTNLTDADLTGACAQCILINANLQPCEPQPCQSSLGVPGLRHAD